MARKDAIQGVTVAIGDGGIGLQEHSEPEAVQVHAGHRRLLGTILGFPVHDRGKGGHPHRGKPLLAGQFHALVGPVGVGLLLETVEDLGDGTGPEDLVRIRNDDGEQERRRDTVPGQGILRPGERCHGGAVHEHLVGNLAGEDLRSPDGPGEGQVHRRLPAVGQHPGNILAGGLRIHRIVADLHRPQGRQGPAEALGVQDDAAAEERVHDIRRLHARPDIEFVGPAEIRDFAVIEGPVQAESQDDGHSAEDGQQGKQPFLPGFYRFFHSFLSLGSERSINSSPSFG